MAVLFKSHKRLRTRGLRQKRAASPTFASAQYAIDLLKGAGCRDKLLGGHGVELKHLVVAWNHNPHARVAGKPRRFASAQISGNTPLRKVPVNWQESDVDAPSLKVRVDFVVKLRVARVVNHPRPGLHDVT